MVNVGKYTIHEPYGILRCFFLVTLIAFLAFRCGLNACKVELTKAPKCRENFSLLAVLGSRILTPLKGRFFAPKITSAGQVDLDKPVAIYPEARYHRLSESLAGFHLYMETIACERSTIYRR